MGGALYMLNLTYTNGYRVGFLDIFSLLAIICGILVIVTKNPIVSVLFLIGLFLSISGYLLLAGASFLGLAYLLVYVGAVSILFLFILMLINIRVSELLSNTKNSIPLAIVVSLAFISPLHETLPFGASAAKFMDFISSLISMKEVNLVTTVKDTLSESNYLNSNINTDELLFATTNLWDGSLALTSDITSIGNMMYSSHMVWLILAGLIILLAMVGAIVITVSDKTKKGENN